MFPAVSRALIPRQGDTSMPESSDGSEPRLCWTVLVRGNVCRVGLLTKPTSGKA